MLSNQLVELYHLLEEERKLKTTLKEQRELISESKADIITGLVDTGHKYAKFRNMEVTMTKKAKSNRLNKEELEEAISLILETPLELEEKRTQIIKLLDTKKQQEATNYCLVIKFTKEKK